MSRCQCLTLKGEQCKNSAKENSIFCGVHKNCSNAISTSTPTTSSSSTSSISATPTKGSRLPIIVPRPRSSKVSAETISSRPIKISIPLVRAVTEKITDQVQAGATPQEATATTLATTLDDLVTQLGYADVTDLVDLTEEEIDYFVSTILLHENQDKLADIVQKKIDEQFVRDPHAKLMIKTRELLEELSSKFCRCIKKVLAANANTTEGSAIAICRRGVINGRGLTFPNFSCKTYPNLLDKSKYLDTPIFLPSKDRKKLLSRHPGYQKYLASVNKGSLITWDALSKLEKDKYLKA